jgi:hypothetical protein
MGIVSRSLIEGLTIASADSRVTTASTSRELELDCMANPH